LLPKKIDSWVTLSAEITRNLRAKMIAQT
jgi:hypothetical protein